METRKQIELAFYRRFRQPSIKQGATYYHVWRTPAKNALDMARTLAAFQECEDETVRLRCEPDEHCDMENLKGDTFNREVNTDIQESRMAREEKEFEESIERDGVWGIIGEYLNPATGQWEHGDSCWGFAGYKDSTDPFENCAVIDIMDQTIDALHKAEKQWEGVQDLARLIVKNRNAVLAALRVACGDVSS